MSDSRAHFYFAVHTVHSFVDKILQPLGYAQNADNSDIEPVLITPESVARTISGGEFKDDTYQFHKVGKYPENDNTLKQAGKEALRALKQAVDAIQPGQKAFIIMDYNFGYRGMDVSIASVVKEYLATKLGAAGVQNIVFVLQGTGGAVVQNKTAIIKDVLEIFKINIADDEATYFAKRSVVDAAFPLKDSKCADQGITRQTDLPVIRKIIPEILSPEVVTRRQIRKDSGDHSGLNGRRTPTIGSPPTSSTVTTIAEFPEVLHQNPLTAPTSPALYSTKPQPCRGENVDAKVSDKEWVTVYVV